MFNRLFLRASWSSGALVAGLIASTACREPVSATSTTGAVVEDDAALSAVAASRCRRAAECNRLGNGHEYSDQAQCRVAYRERLLPTPASCAGGVDRGRLDRCLATLAGQNCDADMGPVTAMPDCDSYCRR